MKCGIALEAMGMGLGSAESTCPLEVRQYTLTGAPQVI